MPTVYTIGHGDRPIDDFLATLEEYEIDLLIDVRSAPHITGHSPYSKWKLPASLFEAGIGYYYLGDSFGSIQTKRKHLDASGQLNFPKYQRSKGFQRGAMELKRRLQEADAIVLMSSPASALSCHRFSMICRYLQRSGWGIRALHIERSGRAYSQRQLEKRLVDFYFRESADRYRLPWSQLVAEAYRRHNRDLGFHR